MNTTTIESLPPSILTSIVLCLPLYSILACREVCTKWNNIILEPFFARMHHNVTRLCLLVIDSSRVGVTRFGFVDLSRSRSRDFADYSLEYTRYSFQSPYRRLYLKGSCNGLVCLAHRDRSEFTRKDHFKLFVFNPIVGNSLDLPDPPQVRGLGCMTHFGFGYIPSTRRYKVVKIAYQHIRHNPGSPLSSQRQPIFYVCTIQTGLASPWRTIVNDPEAPAQRIGQPETASDVCHCPAFLKGSLIWTLDPGPGERKGLVYFDIVDEHSQTLWFPYDMFEDHDESTIRGHIATIGVGVYNDEEGHNQLYVKEDSFSYTRIWVMDDLKSMDSLRLKWVIQSPHRERVPVHIFKVFKDGVVLISLRGSILAYFDPETKVLETFDMPEVPTLASSRLDKPSLLGCMLRHRNFMD